MASPHVVRCGGLSTLLGRCAESFRTSAASLQGQSGVAQGVAKQLDHGAGRWHGRRSQQSHLGAAAPPQQYARRNQRGSQFAPLGDVLRSSASRSRFRYRGKPHQILGRPRRRIRLAGIRTRHHRAARRQRLDWRQRRLRPPAAQVHQRRKIYQAAGQTLQGTAQQRVYYRRRPSRRS